MKPNDLRIGNLVQRKCDQKVLKIIHIKENVRVEYIRSDTGLIHKPIQPFNEIKPIDLTEEWLFKFSFEKCSCAGYKLSGKVNFHIEKDFTYKGSYIKEMKVHQLQNLYFALTGEELTVNN